MAETTKSPFITAYGKKKKVSQTFAASGRTKQSFREECDINNIMKKYQVTGLLTAVNKHQPQYGDVTGVDFQTAMTTIVQAEQMFGDLPSSVRKRFQNDPAEFLGFVNDPDNRDEAVKLGLIVEPSPETPGAPAAPAEPAPTPEAPQATPTPG